ncbi:hypothetical protein [Aliarcobacter butzleri]|uniref:hypothetical protein n=1 Tax=Aliarcobacter butzleri TaxID=28197 RepID=UPI002B247AFE|nr:hypothetical protein [Aliarcobacter butzleri]
MTDILNFTFAEKAYNWLDKKIMILNNVLSIKFPFFWATNIIYALFFTFILYVVIVSIYFIIPIYFGISQIFLSLIYISPISFLIYLNNCFQNKEKNEILVLEFSIFKLLFNNLLYLIISFSFIYLVVWIVEYKIKYNDVQIKFINEYYDTKNEIILKYKKVINSNEEPIDINEIITKTEKELNNERNKNEYFYKEYEEDLKKILYHYNFLESKNNSSDVRKNQRNIEKEIDTIKATKQTIGIIKNLYHSYTFIIVLFSVIYILGFISNISNLGIGVFLAGFVLFIGLSSPIFISEFNWAVVMFILPIISYLYKKFTIKYYLGEILFYTAIITIAGFYSYYIIYIEEKYFSILISNIIFLAILIVWSIIWYIFYFRLKLLSPKIKMNI